MSTVKDNEHERNCGECQHMMNYQDPDTEADKDDGTGLAIVTRAQTLHLQAEEESRMKEEQQIAREMPYYESEHVNMPDDIDTDEKEVEKNDHVEKGLRTHKLQPCAHPKREYIAHNIDSNELQEVLNDVALQDISKRHLRKAQLNDQFCADLIKYLENETIPPTTRRQCLCIIREMDYCVMDRMLWQIWHPYSNRKDEAEVRLVIPKSLQTQLLKNNP
jgi:hypothetical protein